MPNVQSFVLHHMCRACQFLTYSDGMAAECINQDYTALPVVKERIHLLLD